MFDDLVLELHLVEIRRSVSAQHSAAVGVLNEPRLIHGAVQWSIQAPHFVEPPGRRDRY